MAILNGSAATQGFNMIDSGEIDFAGQDALNNGPTEFSWLTSNGHDIQATGSGITFSGGLATGGTVSQIDIDLGNNGFATPDVVITGTNVNLVDITSGSIGFLTAVFAGDDSLTGTGFDDYLIGDKGAGGDDTINGGDGNDTIDGSDGDDSLIGGEGADSLIGGAGNDILREALSGGDGFVDTILGGLGDDTVIVGSAIGGDSFDGGDGIDFIDWSGSAQDGGTFNLATGSAGSEPMLNFENFKGTGGADNITGSSVANRLEGAGGNDTLFGGNGDDTLIGGAGADSINGGDGIDIASYSGALFAGVRVALWDPSLNTGDAAGDIIQFTTEIVEGSGFDDNIQGNSSNNELRGGFGNDLILGGFGDDTLEGNAGGDDMGGGAGTDTVTYRNSGAAVTVVLSSPGMNTGDAAGDNIRADIEIIEGSEFGDSLQGNAANNEFRGGDGNDTILGGFGNDTLKGGGGADSINGGDGYDIASYADGFGVRVALWDPSLNTGIAAGDIINFQTEVVLGSLFDDNLQGNASNNELRGNSGNDLILGGFGDDTLEGGAGADDIGGGAGFDTASYANSTVGVTVVLSNPGLNTGDAVGDNIRPDVERVQGSNFADTLQGNASENNLSGGGGDDSLLGAFGNDTLLGLSGNDTLIGGDGNDFLDGFGGNDVMTGGAGSDTFAVFANEGPADVITDFAAGAAVNDVIRLVGFGAGFDTFAEVIAASTQVGANTVIDFGAQTLTLNNVVLGNLNVNDFTFV